MRFPNENPRRLSAFSGVESPELRLARRGPGALARLARSWPGAFCLGCAAGSAAGVLLFLLTL